MCRNIRTLFNFEPPATEDEIYASALQFVRKLSGFTPLSRRTRRRSSVRFPTSPLRARRLLESLGTMTRPAIAIWKPKRRARVRASDLRKSDRLRSKIT